MPKSGPFKTIQISQRVYDAVLNKMPKDNFVGKPTGYIENVLMSFSISGISLSMLAEQKHLLKAIEELILHGGQPESHTAKAIRHGKRTNTDLEKAG